MLHTELVACRCQVLQVLFSCCRTSEKGKHNTVRYNWRCCLGRCRPSSGTFWLDPRAAHMVKSPTSGEDQHHMKHVSCAVEKVDVAWRQYSTAKPLEEGSAQKVPDLKAWDHVLPLSPYRRSKQLPTTCNFHKRGHWGGRIVDLFYSGQMAQANHSVQ